MSVTMTIGTLTRKIDPYQKCSSSAPPVIGPKATAMPDVAPQMPRAFCRSDGSGKTLVRMARLAGKMKAAATPMSARLVMRVPVECDACGGGREEPEEHETDLHGALAPEAVTDPSPRQQQAGKGEAVGVDDPLERRDGRPEAAVQGGQGDVDDGVVDDHEEDGQAEDCEHYPAAILGWGGGAWRASGWRFRAMFRASRLLPDQVQLE